jgi:hypothetical protein
MLKSANDLKTGGIERHGQFITITADPHIPTMYHIKRHPSASTGHAWTTRPGLKKARFVARQWRWDERWNVKRGEGSKPPQSPMGTGHDYNAK